MNLPLLKELEAGWEPIEPLPGRKGWKRVVGRHNLYVTEDGECRWHLVTEDGYNLAFGGIPMGGVEAALAVAKCIEENLR